MDAVANAAGAFQGRVAGGVINYRNFSNVRRGKQRLDAVLQPMTGIPVDDADSNIHRKAILLPDCEIGLRIFEDLQDRFAIGL